MGGNALKNIQTKRLTKDIYLKYQNEIINLIEPYVSYYYIPRYFPNKETFGDIDIVYIPRNNVDNFITIIKELFQSKDSFHNGNVISLEYKEFQVDFIHSNLLYYENHCCFLDFNDFGGILGQMVSRYELKYGFEGFYYKVHRDHIREHFIGEILLSSKPQVIFNYLGLDYNTFMRGFETPIEMFQFLSTCIYCSRKSYETENINTVHRKRLQHRPIYQQFIEYLSTTSTSIIPTLPIHESLNSLPTHKQFILDTFHCEDAYNKIIQVDEVARLVKLKFNGGLVKDLTGLEGKKLGKFIYFLKNYIYDNNTNTNTIVEDDTTQDQIKGENENETKELKSNQRLDEVFNHYIINSSEELIQQLIVDTYQNYFIQTDSIVDHNDVDLKKVDCVEENL